MSTSLLLACFWVLASAAVALLPMRRQYAPGVVLLGAAPLLIGYIGYQHGWFLALVGLAGFVSMFRNPLIYFYRKWRGLPVQLPTDTSTEPKP